MEELLDDNLSLNNSDDSRLDSNSDRESLSLSAGIQRAMGTGGTRLKVSKSSSDSDDESSLLEELEIEEPGTDCEKSISNFDRKSCRIKCRFEFEVD